MSELEVWAALAGVPFERVQRTFAAIDSRRDDTLLMIRQLRTAACGNRV